MCEKITELGNNEKKWVRNDKKECSICGCSFSTSPELFEVEFTDGEKILYCNVCIGEGPLGEVPEDIKIIRRVG